PSFGLLSSVRHLAGGLAPSDIDGARARTAVGWYAAARNMMGHPVRSGHLHGYRQLPRIRWGRRAASACEQEPSRMRWRTYRRLKQQYWCWGGGGGRE